MKALALIIVSLILFACTNEKQSNSSITESSIIVVPFEISDANNIIFKTVLNGVDSIDLFFDTGGTGIVMRHEAIQTRTSSLFKNSEIYKQADFEAIGLLNTLSIGGFTIDSLTIYPVGVGPDEAAGHFGWDLFEGKIISIDYEKKELCIHPSLGKLADGYTKLPIEYTHTLFCIQASISVNNQIYKNRYLFDTGFQRALLLDKDLNQKAEFPNSLPMIKESKLKNSAGEVFVNKIIEVDHICFNSLCAELVPTHLLDLPNPADFETHILGNELLMRFNTILDFKNHFVYLKPNSRMKLPYMDAV